MPIGFSEMCRGFKSSELCWEPLCVSCVRREPVQLLLLHCLAQMSCALLQNAGGGGTVCSLAVLSAQGCLCWGNGRLLVSRGCFVVSVLLTAACSEVMLVGVRLLLSLPSKEADLSSLPILRAASAPEGTCRAAGVGIVLQLSSFYGTQAILGTSLQGTLLRPCLL